MNKNELISEIKDRTGNEDISKKTVEEVITAFWQVITDALKDGEKVQYVGYGTFELRKRSARTGHNPRTQEPMEIGEAVVPVFKAGKILKDAVAHRE